MALITCPECGKKVSSASKVCVNCGFNLSAQDDEKKFIELAKLSLQGQAHDKVVEYCDKAIEINPKSSEAWYIKAQSVGWGSSLNNMKYDQTVLAFEKAIEFSSNKTKTADELVSPCSDQVAGLVENAKNIFKMSVLTLGADGIDSLHMLMNYWFKILSNPNISEQKLTEFFPIYKRYSEMATIRGAAKLYNNGKYYDEVLLNIIQDRHPNFKFIKSKAPIESKEDKAAGKLVASSVNPGLYFLITVLLGYLGINQFMLGKTGKGILYLFTFGLFGLGYMWDIIEFLTGKTTDKHGNRIRLL